MKNLRRDKLREMHSLPEAMTDCGYLAANSRSGIMNHVVSPQKERLAQAEDLCSLLAPDSPGRVDCVFVSRSARFSHAFRFSFLLL
jgi:hypothetical protein